MAATDCAPKSLTSSPFTAEELTRYAEVTVGRCTDLRAGELLVIEYEPEHRPLMVAIAEEAYRHGLRVSSQVRDPLLIRAEVEHAAEPVLGVLEPWNESFNMARTGPGAGLISIKGEELPGVLDGCDPDRLARRARRQAAATGLLYDRVREGRDAFVIVAFPTVAWASRVYPDRPAALAQRALAEDLLVFCRIGPEDPCDALERHVETLRHRAQVANQLHLREVHFRGPGTDLRVGLTGDALWSTAEFTNAYGRTMFRNLPSEEIFTAPGASLTDGVVRCTKPFAAQGIMAEDVRMEFRDGRLVRLDAWTDAQRDALATRLDVDEGGRRLGELALVDIASRVGQRDRVFWNTLLDENQTCHIGLGLGFPDCRAAAGDSADLNYSRAHVDLMIGGTEVEVTGLTASGSMVPLIVDGTWRP